MKVFVVMPAYNEGKVIAGVVRNLEKSGFKKVVVVDDGSRDDTFDQASKTKAIVLRHVVNRGQGAALQTGISYALEHGADVIVTYDSDGQHQAKDVKKMIPLVKSGGCDAVLGSRFLRGAGKIPLHRRVLLLASLILQKFVWRIPLSDAHNGLRVLSRKMASRLRITSDRMEHASQVSEQIVRSGLKYREVPVHIIYTDYTLEKGHGSLLGGFKILFQFFKRKLLE